MEKNRNPGGWVRYPESSVLCPVCRRCCARTTRRTRSVSTGPPATSPTGRVSWGPPAVRRPADPPHPDTSSSCASTSWVRRACISVPDPPEPRVFWPPGSGSTSQRYGSGSFYHHAKKNLESYYIVTILDFLSLKINVNVPSKINKQKKLCKKICFLLAS